MSNDLTRFTTEDIRVYTDGADLFLPSVTSCIDQKPEPEGLKYWKEKNDGTDGNPRWQDILSYKADRGTLIHYELLNEFFDGDMYGENEESAEESLKNTEGNNLFEDEWSSYQEDLSFARNAWAAIKSERTIDAANVIRVECFVTNTNIGYAGQFDLLYIDPDGNLVLSDLKTSKRIYDKHKMQLVAYEHALNLDIDTLEVLRIHPDSKSYEISHDDEWFEDREHYWDEFCELRGTMNNLESRMEQALDDGVEDA